MKSAQQPDQASQERPINIQQDYQLHKGDTVKLGRLKFRVKDFRTETTPANSDLRRQGIMDRSASPVKQRYNFSAE